MRQSDEMSRSTTRLSDHDIAAIYDKLKNYSYKWREIGRSLGFAHHELATIEANQPHQNDATYNYMSAMLAEWQQWAPGDSRGTTSHATLESLRRACSGQNWIWSYCMHASCDSQTGTHFCLHFLYCFNFPAIKPGTLLSCNNYTLLLYIRECDSNLYIGMP